MPGHSIIGDEPVDAGGRDLGPATFDLLAASLAECTAMTVRWFARQRDWPLEHVEVKVDFRKKSVEGAALDLLEKKVSLRGAGLTGKQRSRLVEIAGQCPVQRLMEGSPVIETKVAPEPGDVG